MTMPTDNSRVRRHNQANDDIPLSALSIEVRVWAVADLPVSLSEGSERGF
ncbi:hypothetical protein E3G67_003702 [Mycobacteroides abscessus]|nr:hypothetical protein [Mycobacteroides abscessus]